MVIEIYEFGKLKEHYNANNEAKIKRYRLEGGRRQVYISTLEANKYGHWHELSTHKYMLIRRYSVIDLHTKRIYKSNNHKDALELIKVFIERCDAPNSNPNRYRIIVKEERI